MPANYLTSAIAFDAFSSGVPTDDVAVRIEHVNGIFLHPLDEETETLPGVPQFSLGQLLILDVGAGAEPLADPAIGNATVDLQLGNQPAIDQYKKQTAAALNAHRVQREPAMFVQLKKRTVISVSGRIRIKCDDIAFGQARHSLDCDLFSGK